jgi:CRP/FNR family transcriptional regulator
MQTIPTDPGARLGALKRSIYFAHLAENILAELVSGTTLASYERGEVVFWQNDPCPGLYIVHSGSVKLFKLSPQGRELIVTFFETGATFNEVPVFDLGENPVSVAAMENCQLWVIEAQAVRKAMIAHPEMCQVFLAHLSKQVRRLVGIVEELSFYQVTNRLARLISILPPEQLIGPGGSRLTQDQIAARLGTVREVVARSLRELERSGAIQMQRRQIHIRDKKVLLEWAQGPFN